MAKISNTISAAPGLINKLVFVIYKTTAPAAEVARIVKDPPHTVPYNFEFNDIESGIYIVKIHESVDGIALGNLRHDYWVDADTGFITNERIFFSVDGPGDNDPVGDTTDYINSDLDGVDITGVFQEGFRYLQPTVEWEPLAGGGIRILNGVFENGQVWSIEIQRTASASSEPPPNDLFSDISLKTEATVTLTNTDFNKTILCRASASIVQDVNMPFIGSVPDGRALLIIHDRGQQYNTTLNAQASELFRFRGQDVSKINLGKGNYVKIFKKTIGAETRWYVTEWAGEWQTLGDIIFCDENINENRLLCNGNEYDLNVFRRLSEYINRLNPAQIRTYAQFNMTSIIDGDVVYINRGFFAVDAVNNRCKLPDLMDKYLKFLKTGADAERVDDIQGGYQHDQVGAFSSSITIALGNSFTGSPGGGWSERPGKGESVPFDKAFPFTANAGKESDVINIAKLPMIQI